MGSCGTLIQAKHVEASVSPGPVNDHCAVRVILLEAAMEETPLEARSNGRCCYPIGRSLRLPSRHQVACAEPDLDGCCFYPTGRGLRLHSRRQVACAEPELDGCFQYPTG